MNTKDIGNICEAMAIAKLIEKGFAVLMPFGDNQRYDLVLETAGLFYTVQVKSGNFKNGVIVFRSCSSYAHRGKGSKDYKGEIDFFAVYVRCSEELYLVPVEEVGSTIVYLRVEKPKNNQNKKVRYAEKYLVK